MDRFELETTHCSKSDNQTLHGVALDDKIDLKQVISTINEFAGRNLARSGFID